MKLYYLVYRIKVVMINACLLIHILNIDVFSIIVKTPDGICCYAQCICNLFQRFIFNCLTLL